MGKRVVLSAVAVALALSSLPVTYWLSCSVPYLIAGAFGIDSPAMMTAIAWAILLAGISAATLVVWKAVEQLRGPVSRA